MLDLSTKLAMEKLKWAIDYMKADSTSGSSSSSSSSDGVDDVDGVIIADSGSSSSSSSRNHYLTHITDTTSAASVPIECLRYFKYLNEASKRYDLIFYSTCIHTKS